ncbi:MAG: large repetitive protein, partial [Gaiellaceae bacterium]|nr:large repetitive protein [Gaiellaceae bacterium]
MSASAHALPRGGIYALRRGRSSRTAMVLGLLALLAGTFVPYVSALRLPAAASTASLPALTVPAYRFPALKPPALAKQRKAQAPVTLPAQPARKAQRGTRTTTVPRYANHRPLSTYGKRVPVVKSTYNLQPPSATTTKKPAADPFAKAPVVDDTIGALPDVASVTPVAAVAPATTTPADTTTPGTDSATTDTTAVAADASAPTDATAEDMPRGYGAANTATPIQSHNDTGIAPPTDTPPPGDTPPAATAPPTTTTDSPPPPSGTTQAAAPTTNDAVSITAAELDSVVAAAEADWISTHPDANFDGVTFTIADLPGLELGKADGTSVTIDGDAAGWGWSVSYPDGLHMDLRSVVTHELGHTLGLEHGDGVMTPTIKPGQTITPDDTTPGSGAQTPPNAIAATLPASTILAAIQTTLASYLNGALSGTHSVTLSDVNIGGVATLTAPTLVFQDITFTGTDIATATFSGTVSITAASASIDDQQAGSGPHFAASASNVTGSYALSGQTAQKGTLTLTLGSLTFAISDFVSVTAASASLKSTYDGSSSDIQVGASGVTATVGTTTAATVSNGSVAIVIKHQNSAVDAKYALLTTGDISVITSAATISGRGWRGTYNQLGDISATPILVSTGSGNLALDFAANGLSLSGAAELTLGTLGSASGTFSITQPTAGALHVTVTNGAASLSAGPATASLTGGTGAFDVDSTGACGSINGMVALAGVPGVGFSSPLALTFDTSGSGTYSFTGVAAPTAVHLTGFLDLGGAIAFTRGSNYLDLAIGSVAARIFSDGTFAAHGAVAVALPATTVLTLSGTAIISVNTNAVDQTISGHPLLAHGVVQASGTLTLGTPVGALSGTLTLTKNLVTNELSVSTTSPTLSLAPQTGTSALQIGGSGPVTVLILPNGTFAFHVEGTPSLTGSDLAFTGMF